MSFAIAEAKLRLPLPDLMAELGLAEHAKKSARCPFHDDTHESFSVVKFGNSWIWKCFAGCGKGDEIAFLKKRDRLSNAQAIRRYCELAGVNGNKGAAISKATAPPLHTPQLEPTSEPDFSEEWRACGLALTDEAAEKLAEWRRYSAEFVHWLRERELIGLYRGKIVLPVHDEAGRVVACHCREENGSWRYYPRVHKVWPLVIGDTKTAESVLVFESQWDAFAVVDKLPNWTKDTTPPVIVTRGSTNGKLVRGLVKRGAIVCAFRQNDELKGGINPANRWLADVVEAATADAAIVCHVAIPAPHKDANDWTRAGAKTEDIRAAMSAAAEVKLSKSEGSETDTRLLIQFFKPSELRDYKPPEDVVLVGDCHLTRGAVTVIGGAPGVGKSRAAVALAQAGAIRADWFGLLVHAHFKTLIVQNENGRFRLSKEFADLDCVALDAYVRVCEPPPLGLAFDTAEFQKDLTEAVVDFEPDVVVLDPWNAVARDEKARDYLDTFRIVRALLPSGDNAPALVIVAHTRKPQNDEKASGRGLLKLLAGSYVLGSVPRCVFVMQAASDDPEDDRIVWTCCKNNDGELGARSAWHRRNGLFVQVTDFDWTEFDNASGTGNHKVSVQEVAETIGAGNSINYSRLAESVAERCDVSERTAKDAIRRAAAAGAIHKGEGGLYEVP